MTTKVFRIIHRRFDNRRFSFKSYALWRSVICFLLWVQNRRYRRRLKSTRDNGSLGNSGEKALSIPQITYDHIEDKEDKREVPFFLEESTGTNSTMWAWADFRTHIGLNDLLVGTTVTRSIGRPNASYTTLTLRVTLHFSFQACFRWRSGNVTCLAVLSGSSYSQWSVKQLNR